MSEEKSVCKVCVRCGGTSFRATGRCIDCAKKYKAAWSEKNAAKVAAYRLENRDRDRLKEAEYRKQYPDKVRAAQLKHIASDPEGYKRKKRAYYDANVERTKARARAFYEATKERQMELTKKWKARNPEAWKEITKRSKEKACSTPVGRLARNVSSRVRSAFTNRGYTKRSKANAILGCDWEFLKQHIERQFLPGMTWEKMGSEIHIDHIVPLDAAETEQDVLLLNHFTNLRPMWAEENIRKSAARVFLI